MLTREVRASESLLGSAEDRADFPFALYDLRELRTYPGFLGPWPELSFFQRAMGVKIKLTATDCGDFAMGDWTAIDWAILAVAGFFAVAILVRMMASRRDQLLDDLSRDVQSQRKTKQ
jgi:hypothetical protein